MSRPLYTKVEEHPVLFECEKDWEKHWVGMPEFVQHKQREFAKVIVRFRSLEDLKEFARITSQPITPETKSMWYPAASRKSECGQYVDEP